MKFSNAMSGSMNLQFAYDPNDRGMSVSQKLAMALGRPVPSRSRSGSELESPGGAPTEKKSPFRRKDNNSDLDIIDESKRRDSYSNYLISPHPIQDSDRPILNDPEPFETNVDKYVLNPPILSHNKSKKTVTKTNEKASSVVAKLTKNEDIPDEPESALKKKKMKKKKTTKIKEK